MTTMQEIQATAKIEARQRVYAALQEVSRLMRDLDIVPNGRDYARTVDFEIARDIHRDRLRWLAEMRNEILDEMKAIQGRATC